MAGLDINLDDRRFEDIVADIRRRIPGYTPEWTDLNDSDPGIAIVQVFAWLAETVLWRINRVPDKSTLRFLRFVGVTPDAAVPARAWLTFTLSEGLTRPQMIRGGTIVSAGSDEEGRPILFETDEDLLASSVAVRAMQIYDGAQFDLVETGGGTGQFFSPFGETPRRGAAWYIGLNAAFPNGRHTLTVQTSSGSPDDQPRAAAVRQELPPPPAQIIWEYWAGDARGWQPLAIVKDETVALTETGRVVFDAPETLPMAIATKAVGLVPLDNPLFWIRVRLVDLLGAGYERVPRVEAMLPNTVSATNAVTVVEELVGTSDGTPNQQFTLANAPVVPDTLLLEVRESLDEDFEPWNAVADLGASGRDDRHFTVNLQTGEVAFGDGRHGRIPQMLTDRRNAAEGRGDTRIANIRATKYRWGGGGAGNAAAGAIASMQTSIPFVESVTNRRAAIGGRDAETAAEAGVRAPLEIRTRSRAVTGPDFEFLARRTPGARVMRAKALSMHHPELEPLRSAGAGQPVTRIPVPGVVTVLVLPESALRRPVIRQETLNLVASHLNRHALVTTEIYVAPPRFRKVEIEVRVVARSDASLGAVGKALEEKLLAYFHPLTGGAEPSGPDQERGWPFGGTIFFSETYRQILGVNGVLRVDAGALKTFLDDVEQPSCTDLALRPDELVWSERHRVEVRYE